MEFQLIVRGGEVVDGTGAGPVPADLAVAGGRIVAIGRLDGASAPAELNASGRYLLPGLIDTHVHLEGVLDQPDVWRALLRQGVTTALLGQDGLSFAPAPAATVHYVQRYFGPVTGPAPAAFSGGVTVAELLRGYHERTPINVGYLVPAGTLRHAVIGPAARAATGAELDRMVGLVEAGLADGALGLSSGLEYVPGAFADAAELATLCAPVAAAGGVYVSHLRGYGPKALAGLAELREIVDRSGIAGHVSHFKGPADLLEPLLDGVDATFDSYPYLPGSTILAMRAVPPELQSGGPDATLDRLADPAVRRRLADAWEADEPLRRVVLAYAGEPRFRAAEGMTLQAAARQAGLAFGDFVGELLVGCALAVGVVLEPPATSTEDDIRRLMRHEGHMGCSDGLYTGSHPHPRGYGAFARFLGRHTRELGDWSWGEAAAHLAGRAARRFGLAGRGTLAPGAVADVVVLDPAAVADTATFADPRRPAAGVELVLVNGQPVLVDGELTGARPGQALRIG